MGHLPISMVVMLDRVTCTLPSRAPARGAGGKGIVALFAAEVELMETEKYIAEVHGSVSLAPVSSGQSVAQSSQSVGQTLFCSHFGLR